MQNQTLAAKQNPKNLINVKWANKVYSPDSVIDIDRSVFQKSEQEKDKIKEAKAITLKSKHYKFKTLVHLSF